MELSKQEIELSKKDMELFLLLPSFTKQVLKTGNGIIQTGYGIISPISWPLIKKLLLQNVSKFYQQV